MRRIFGILEKERWSLASLVLTLLCCLLGGGVMYADATVVVTTDTNPAPQAGQAGLGTQVSGSPTTVSAVADAGGSGGDGLIQPEIDSQLFEIGTDETVLDGLMRKAKRQVKVKSFEVDHYLIDEKKAFVQTTAAVSQGDDEQFVLTVAAGDRGYFQDNGTVLCKGVNGYTEDGKTALPGVDLMLFVVGKDSSKNPIVIAVNGPKKNTTDEYCITPAIPNKTTLILMANACAETQKEVAPNLVVPVPQRVYLQKMILNQIISDYFEAQRKRIPFHEAQIAEAAIKQFRKECNRTLWVGQKKKIRSDRGKMGVQTIYFTEGIRWQFKRTYEHEKDTPWTFEQIIELAKMKFTGENCTSKAWWLMGKDMLEAIQNIDFTKHKDITMTGATEWGFSCTKLHTVFGDFYLKHEPTLDRIGYENQGGIIDFDGLTRYWMKNEEKTSDNIEGEEAKRNYLISWDCLALKGTSHIWVNGDKASS